MAKPSRYTELVRTVTKDVALHPRDLTRYYTEKLGISRVATNRYIRKLENDGWIARSGPSTHPVFSPGYRRTISQLYLLNKLEEHEAWQKDFRPHFTLSPNVTNIVSIGFTEMVNNAIDHSSGKSVFVWMKQDEQHLSFFVSDDGIGIFQKITQALNLPDMRQALFELSKGKFTTDPDNHSGEGVFFSSRMFDRFSIYANDLTFDHFYQDPHDWIKEENGGFDDGTTVYMKIELTSSRTAADVYSQFNDPPGDAGFSKTIIPMRLATYGDEQLVSRSQAKRLIARFDRFKIVILDFDRVQEIGQAFADELFRVYANAHPEVEMVPGNMTEQVERMWLRSVSPRLGDAGSVA